MAKRVFIQGICDVCNMEYDSGVAGQTLTIDDGGNAGVYEIDLCPAHAEILHNDYLTKARVVKRKKADKPVKPTVVDPSTGYLPEAATKAYSGRPRTEQCPQKGCDYMGPDRRSIGVHLNKVHGIKANK